MAPWIFTWTIALAIYAACKWLTYCEARARGVTTNSVRALG
jgi:hypothetical protein